MTTPLDPFIPEPDESKRHSTTVRAPADFVLEVARDFDFQSIPLVHAIFWLRGKLLRSRESPPARGMGIVAMTRSGPVVASTPGVNPHSGWPGVRAPHCRNDRMSSSDRS